MKVNRMDDNTIAVVFCNWNTANKMIELDENVQGSLVVSSYLDDDEAIVVERDEFLRWLRGEQDGQTSGEPDRMDNGK